MPDAIHSDVVGFAFSPFFGVFGLNVETNLPIDEEVTTLHARVELMFSDDGIVEESLLN